MSKRLTKLHQYNKYHIFFVPLSLGAEGEDPEQAGAAGPLPAAALRRRLQLPLPGDGPRDAAREDDGDAGGARDAQPLRDGPSINDVTLLGGSVTNSTDRLRECVTGEGGPNTPRIWVTSFMDGPIAALASS